jgi:hypothetical protein
MMPTQDALATLKLALQKIERAHRALAAHNLAWAESELILVKLCVEDAQGLLSAPELCVCGKPREAAVHQSGPVLRYPAAKHTFSAAGTCPDCGHPLTRHERLANVTPFFVCTDCFGRPDICHRSPVAL